MKSLFLLLLTSSIALGFTGRTPNEYALTEFFLVEDIPDVVTTDATQTNIKTHTLSADGQTWLVTTTCHANGTNIETFKKAVSASRASGTTTINGTSQSIFNQGGSNYALTYDTSGADLRTQVTGAVADSVTWHCIYMKESLQ